MTQAVIDTNILLAANNRHSNISPECAINCIRRLTQIEKRGVVAIDDAWRIVGEYRIKTHLNQPKGTGDVFLKWLLRNLNNQQRVHQVTVTEFEPDFFDEFPDPELQSRFDPPDRKFAAVANAHPDKPPVWQATDCKWLDWWSRLKKVGVTIEFLCPEDVYQFYRAKFPGKTLPPLPD